jgi:Flp pilus assembly protein TadG
MSVKQRRTLSRRCQQRGAVVLVFALSLLVLIGFAGLAIDLGRFFVIKSELQNAVDACALAAATQLSPGQNNPAALTNAVAYGRVFATGGSGNIGAIKNRANFQSEVVAIEADQITFSDTLNGIYQTSAGANFNTAAYAKCTYPLAGLPIFFMRVLNPALSTQTVSAMAAATLAPSSSNCAIPIGVCKVPGSSAANNFGHTPGDWLDSRKPYGTGNFGWIDFTPPAGGASELANQLTGSGQCALKTNDTVGEQGMIQSLDIAWNSRFGLYKGALNVGNAPPDKTGYAYSKDKNWPSGRDAYGGSSPLGVNYKTASTSALYNSYQGDTPLGMPTQGYKISSPAEHQAYGMKNRRLAVAPVVDCSVWNTSGSAQPTMEGWACVLMLNPIAAGTPPSPEVWDTPVLEFLGLSTTPGSPCATAGEAGRFGPLVPVLVQ